MAYYRSLAAAMQPYFGRSSWASTKLEEKYGRQILDMCSAVKGLDRRRLLKMIRGSIDGTPQIVPGSLPILSECGKHRIGREQ